MSVQRSTVACTLALVLLLASACGSGRRAEPQTTRASAPLHLAGQRVLVLPLQRLQGSSSEQRERVLAELLFALSEREPRTTWISPTELQSALRRTPAFAADPANLPSDPLLHRREPRAGEALGGELRRFSALMDVRLILLPREARFVRAEGASEGSLHLGAALLDARTGQVLWWGEAAGQPGAGLESRVVASAAEALAQRLLAGPERETRP